MLKVIYSLLLGVVQGVTEFLPVSSSGHLTILQHWLHIYQGDVFFDLILHMGTILAVFIFFSKEILNVLKMFLKPFGKESRLLHYLIIGTIITAIFVLPLKDKIEGFFNTTTLIYVGIALIITGILNLLSQKMINKHYKNDGSFLSSILIGFLQFIATIPGISRSGSTIFASLIMKNSPEFSFNFSFLLSIPAILGAFILETKDYLHNQHISNVTFISGAVGFLAAFISGYFALKILKKIIMSKNYYIFGVYAIILGIIVLLV